MLYTFRSVLWWTAACLTWPARPIRRCSVYSSRSNSTAAAMHFHRTVSPSQCRPQIFSGVLLILCCLTGAILAQTFQYSRGWTNGRKRAGPAYPGLFSPSASGPEPLQSPVESSAAISNPCSELQRIKFLLGARNPQHVCTWLLNCEGIWLNTTHFWNVTPCSLI